MAFTDANINYVTKWNTLVTLLRDNSTTLNADLTEATITNTTNQIKPGIPTRTPQFRGLYPMVLVALNNKTEDWHNLGAAGRKYPIINFRIWAMIKMRKGAVETLQETAYLAGSIEEVFRSNTKISGVALWSQPTETDFGINEANKIYIGTAIIDMEMTVKIE